MKVVILPNVDAKDYAWRRLRNYQNSEFVAHKIEERFNANNKHQSNIKKQAVQIRYCLQQAEEFAIAADSVSAATKPLLLYYSAMSFALAQILWRQDGKSSLDANRSKHGHHGLEVSIVEVPSGSLLDKSLSLKAKPHFKRKNGKEWRSGTFELWHQTARAFPLIGNTTKIIPIGTIISSSESILFSENERMIFLPKEGISLLECFEMLPSLRHYLPSLGIAQSLFRTNITSEYDMRPNRGTTSFSMTAYENKSGDSSKFMEALMFHPAAVNLIETNMFPGGFGVSWTITANQKIELNFPGGFTETTKESFFSCEELMLNEFGYFYVALFICGMYSRYWPDYWMKEIEKTSPLFLAIEHLMNEATERMTLLTLSEFTGEYYLKS